MSALISYATCRRCKAKIEIPPLPLIVGETPEQKAVRLGALEMKTILKHLTGAHPEARDHMIAWGQVFSEFYFLAAFDFQKCQEFLDRYDAQRLLLLGLCQQRPPDIGPEVQKWADDHDTPESVLDFYEETDRRAELEAAGYHITRGFLGEEESKVVL